MLAFLLSRTGIAMMVVLAVMAVIGVQTLRLNHARHEIVGLKASLIDPTTRKTWQSEAQAATQALGRCNGSLVAQNAAVAASAAETARKLASAEKGRGDALAVAQSYRKSAAAVRAYQPKGADVCARTADVDAMIVGDLKP